MSAKIFWTVYVGVLQRASDVGDFNIGRFRTLEHFRLPRYLPVMFVFFICGRDSVRVKLVYSEY